MDNFKSTRMFIKMWQPQSNPHSNISYYCNELLTQFSLQTPFQQERPWRNVLQTIVRPDIVIFPDELFRLHSNLIQVIKQVRTKHLITISPVESLNVCILIWLCWLNKLQFDAVALTPLL